MKKTFLTLIACLVANSISAQKTFQLTSPDGKVQTNIQVADKLTYDILVDGQQILAPSAISMTLSNGTQWGQAPKLSGQKKSAIDQEVKSPFYRQQSMQDKCNALTLSFKGNYSVEFRAYDNGVAYRLINNLKKPFEVVREGVEYNFPADYEMLAPYVKSFDPQRPQVQFFNSFENWYTNAPISKLDQRRYSFLPLVANTGKGIKLCLTETHLENYPGLYLQAQGQSLQGVNAPYPKDIKQGGHNNLQMIVQNSEPYIAKVQGQRTFPWRIAMICRNDAEMAANNLSYLLAAPCRVEDYSWVKPGKVAWDWWNDWNLAGVDFETGVNDATYKYYIDFASKRGIEYVILDEGWAVNGEANLMQVVPEIHLQELVDYARQKNVGIILWAGYWAFERDMETVCKHYSQMGVKGFKVDFMDRDDQIMTDFYYRAAAMAAQYHLMLDFHGAFKPSGLNRTYPNVVNFEGVAGLEQMKWMGKEHDQITYDVQIPFIRQASGPMDYTQGAMINAVKGTYVPNNAEPMSQGTRCHQLGMYMVLESPLSMLCDSPTNYEILGGPCTDFIARVPTVWDETIILDGQIGKYIIAARRSGNKWYVGGMTNWDARDVTIPTDFLSAGNHQYASFTDGPNAHRKGSDYLHKNGSIAKGEPLKIHMAPGGGFAIEIK